MQKKPIIFQVRPLWGQCEAEDVEAKTAKGGKWEILQHLFKTSARMTHFLFNKRR